MIMVMMMRMVIIMVCVDSRVDGSDVMMFVMVMVVK